MKYFVLIIYFIGSGLLWGQTQENYITYEGLEYTFVEMQQGADGYYYCAGLHLTSFQYKLFILKKELEIEYMPEERVVGPIGLHRSGDSVLMATYDNVSHDFTISSISYETSQIEKDTILTQKFVDYYLMDSTNIILFGYVQIKVIDGKYMGLMVSSGTSLGSPTGNSSYYFNEKRKDTLSFGVLEQYHPSFPGFSGASSTYDFNLYMDSLLMIRSITSVGIYDKNFNLIDGGYAQESMYNQGFILSYGKNFIDFERVVPNSDAPFETVPTISFLNDDFSVIKADSFWSPQKAWFGAPAILGGLTSNQKQDTFYACATQGHHRYYKSGIIDADAQAYVRAYDDAMNHLWELVIGDTLVHVSILKMERMSNGNLMLIGSEGHRETNYNFRPLVIEIDPHGTVVSTTNPVPVQSVDVTLSPNPAVDLLTVGWQGDYSEVDLQIINSSGQQVQRFQRISLPTTLEVGHLPAGMYYLSLFRKGRMVASQPFVKTGG